MTLGSLRSALAFLLLVYLLSPVIFKHSLFIQRSLLFMNNVNTQYHVNLSHPDKLGLPCTRTLRLANQLRLSSSSSPESQVPELGVWHILPHSRIGRCSATELDGQRRITMDDGQLAFDDRRPIVLYVHGNGGTRAGEHRLHLYKELISARSDLHVVAFDYCGYGDSTYLAPTAAGLSSDARAVYDWLLEQPKVSPRRLIVWGHSLGTAVAVRMVADLPDHLRPRQLILEAPFDSIANAVAHHPFSTPFRIMPYFHYFFTEPIASSEELNFDSSARIAHIGPPTKILILHAEDDVIIPHKLGQNLYERAREKLGQHRVSFISLPEEHQLGHKLISRHAHTMSQVHKFIKDDALALPSR